MLKISRGKEKIRSCEGKELKVALKMICKKHTAINIDGCIHNDKIASASDMNI